MEEGRQFFNYCFIKNALQNQNDVWNKKKNTIRCYYTLYSLFQVYSERVKCTMYIILYYTLYFKEHFWIPCFINFFYNLFVAYSVFFIKNKTSNHKVDDFCILIFWTNFWYSWNSARKFERNYVIKTRMDLLFCVPISNHFRIAIQSSRKVQNSCPCSKMAIIFIF